MAKTRKQIHLLSDQVANKIAAGEVVDRPSSVLKELMENSLDAGATQLDVEVVDGGRKVISVADNGAGMRRDDALMSIERHATSKIKDVDDIENVMTLGFRGEALAAISSVSRFSLTTRPKETKGGTEVLMAGGKIQEVQDVGCPPGTSIAVRHLFFNVPARKKFLRSEQTEAAHVRRTFVVYGISHPEVGMTLKVDGREAYNLPAGATLEERIRDLFGNDVLQSVRPVAYELQNLTIRGYVAQPHLTRGDRSDQYIFINGRPAMAPMLAFALQEGYSTLVPRGRYPMVFLFIDIDPTKVDVNVHPAKREVRFRQPIMVRDAIIEAVRESLAAPGGEVIPGVAGEGEDEGQVAPLPEVRLAIEDLPASHSFNYPRIPMTPDAPAGGEEVGEDARSETMPTSLAPWSECRVLGQVGGLYVVLETHEGLVLMDPHAAHERILYEQFMKETLQDEVKGQGLLVPETVELAAGDADCLRKNIETLKHMGFGISEFGGDTFIVDAVPKVLGNASVTSLLADVVQGLERSGSRGGTERWAENAVATAACRAAVKARDKLSLQEVEQLVVDLARAEMPYTCPHGRPTVIFMGFGELDRKFGRT